MSTMLLWHGNIQYFMENCLLSSESLKTQFFQSCMLLSNATLNPTFFFIIRLWGIRGLNLPPDSPWMMCVTLVESMKQKEEHKSYLRVIFIVKGSFVSQNIHL